jgi:ribosomal protein L40E
MDKKEKTTSWSWKISAEELKEQIENYNTLKITQSYRGVAVLIVSALLLLSLVLGYFGVYASFQDIILGLFIYIPVLFFVYKGHRWAIITLLALWTLEKAYTIYLSVQSSGSPIGSIIWWLIVAPYIYKALKVENERRKIKDSSNMKLDGVYCTNCGTRQGKSAKFCTKCGVNLNTFN